MIVAFIYTNPITTINKTIRSKKYPEDSLKNYIPDLEFCLIFGVGLMMLLSVLFNYTPKEEEDNNKEIRKDNNDTETKTNFDNKEKNE